MTIPAGAMSAKDIAELNEELKGQAYIMATGRSSHMWDAEMCVHFLEDFVGKCLAIKRKKLGLDRDAKAMLICDRAPCHLHAAYLALRKNWCTRENVIIFGDDKHADVTVPA